MKKSISLCFMGFDQPPETLEKFLGVASSELGRKGDPVKKGGSTKLRRSFVRYSIELPDECRLDEMLPILFNSLGGLDRLIRVKSEAMPEFIDIDIVLRIKNSEDQEGGFFPSEIIKNISSLGAQLSFQFL